MAAKWCKRRLAAIECKRRWQRLAKRERKKVKVYGRWMISWANGVSSSHNSSHRKGGSHKMHGEAMSNSGSRASDR